MDAAGRRRPAEEIRHDYGDAANVNVLPDPQWSPEAILAGLAGPGR